MLNVPYMQDGPSLFFPEFQVVLRGIFVERSGCKDVVYIRDLFCLAFRRTRHLSVRFSERIVNEAIGEGHTSFRGSVDEIVGAAALSARSHLTDGCWQDGPSMNSIRAKARHIDVNAGEDPELTFDLAALALLQGDMPYAARCFHGCASWLARYEPHHELSADARVFIEELKSFVSLFQTAPDDLKSILLRRVRTNAAALGYVSTAQPRG